MTDVAPSPVVTPSDRPILRPQVLPLRRRWAYDLAKRSIDIVIAGLILIAISPLLIPICIAQKCTGEGHIFYLQERVGWLNQSFHIIKFATMLFDSPSMEGGIITAKRDPRVLPLGGFLRKTKINELPQLINVLKGDMTLVGPRPVMQLSFEQYPDEIQKMIYRVKPGITGIGSIVFRDEESILERATATGRDPWHVYREDIYPFKGQLERWYQDHRSLTLDLNLLVCTALVIVKPSSTWIYRKYPSIPQWQDSLIHS